MSPGAAVYSLPGLAMQSVPDDLPPWRRWFEICIQVLIFYSILCYYFEIEMTGGSPSKGWWVVNEQVVAILFTLEYLFRWAVSHDRRGHPFRAMAVIDLLAILPFYLSFLVDFRVLRLVRTLRVLRLLKLYRYNAALQHVLS